MPRPTTSYIRKAKKIVGYVHLWLGLLSGAVIFLSMIGAAIFVWEEELTDWYYADLIFNHQKEPIGTLPVSELHSAVTTAYPGKEFTFLEVTSDTHRNYAWMSYQPAEHPGWTWPSGVEHYLLVHVNPYTGEVVGAIDYKKDWIMLSRFLHQTLLLRYEVGTEIIGAAGLIMVIMALSGLVLWWPKTFRSLKRRVKVKWQGTFKRINWDAHAAGGFYTYLFLIFFAATGLVWSYTWWGDAIHRLLGDDPKAIFSFPEPPKINAHNYLDGMDLAFDDAVSKRPNWQTIYFSVPKASSVKGSITAGIYFKDKDIWWVPSDHYYYDPKTGEIYHTLLHEEKLTGEKWRYSNYEMHVGSIYGTPTKVIAFACAVFFGFLPISGFLIWWGRRKKENLLLKKAHTISSVGAGDPETKPYVRGTNPLPIDRNVMQD
ncbi:MAG: PepSY-associated TM helix domain-containing protein [Bacteroidota bacterium]